MTLLDYALLDFGAGRRLERFGQWVVDRPCPVATGPVADARLWGHADAVYDGAAAGEGDWSLRSAGNAAQPGGEQQLASWQVSLGTWNMELRLTPAGQVGLFPEQLENWEWLARQVARARRPLKVLNLFAYTGGSTLAAASAGAEVVHVDASGTAVAWARQNATLSGLADHPIRWIVDDALKFARRELRRGRQYDAVILDPPSYGHGPKGESWKLSRHLLALLEVCGQLTRQARACLLLTGHTPGFGPAEFEASLADAVFGHCAAGVQARDLTLRSVDGRRLPCGTVARWPTGRSTPPAPSWSQSDTSAREAP